MESESSNIQAQELYDCFKSNSIELRIEDIVEAHPYTFTRTCEPKRESCVYCHPYSSKYYCAYGLGLHFNNRKRIV